MRSEVAAVESSMAEGIRYARSIYAAEMLVQATFGDFIPASDDCCDRTVSLQKEFKIHALLASRRFESLRADLCAWRDRVRCGDVEFDPEREDDFKSALRAFIALASLLDSKFDLFHKGGVYLTHPKFIGLLQSQKKEAERILDSWRSPEWEVRGMRNVKWNEEQTRHLLDRLASCE
jgi:hypothetical protein